MRSAQLGMRHSDSVLRSRGRADLGSHSRHRHGRDANNRCDAEPHSVDLGQHRVKTLRPTSYVLIQIPDAPCTADDRMTLNRGTERGEARMLGKLLAIVCGTAVIAGAVALVITNRSTNSTKQPDVAVPQPPPFTCASPDASLTSLRVVARLAPDKFEVDVGFGGVPVRGILRTRHSKVRGTGSAMLYTCYRGKQLVQLVNGFEAPAMILEEMSQEEYFKFK